MNNPTKTIILLLVLGAVALLMSWCAVQSQVAKQIELSEKEIAKQELVIENAKAELAKNKKIAEAGKAYIEALGNNIPKEEKPAPVVEAADESEIAEAEAATKSAQVAAPQAPRLTQDEMYAALEDVKLVAARVLSSGLIGSEIVSIARDAFTKYSKAEAASALVDEILKVSTFFPLSLYLSFLLSFVLLIALECY